MCTIAESKVLLLERAEFPAGFKVATDEFRDGWNRMRSGGKRRLEKKIQTHGWNFIRIGGGALRSGVGVTSQQAIAGALKLALRRLDARSNAVEVARIELTQYPWFFLARVNVHSYRIQQGAVLPVWDEDDGMQTVTSKLLSPQSAALFPQFGCAMPMLKELLVASGISAERPR